MMETYLIVIGKTATGYSAHCPDVLGCAAIGKTVEEVLVNMKKALEFHFEGMVEDPSRGSRTRAPTVAATPTHGNLARIVPNTFAEYEGKGKNISDSIQRAHGREKE